MTRDGIELAYGRGMLPLALPPGAEATVIRKAVLPKLPDNAAAIRHAFDHPVGAKPLSALAQGRHSACILICDITRPVPNRLFLRPMVETMVDSGIPLDRITILVATGLHRPNLGDELAEVVGDPWIMANVRVENHYARDSHDHVDLGVTATRGTPVSINRILMEADLRIATGLVEPHFMAGWSGGRKVVAPGVAGHATIRTFHSARFMEDPLALQCNLVGNPLHEEQLEIVRMVGELYALNTVIDEDRDLVHVTFGEIIQSHLGAVAFIEDATRIKVGRRFKTVVTSSAGYPLDKTYYQTVKGMVTPIDILEPGGTLIIASRCSEGFGSPEFREAQAKLVDLGAERFLATLTAKSLAEVDEWQTEMQLKPMRVGRIQLYTEGLDAEELRITGVEIIGSVDAAIADSVARHGDGAVAIIPEGPYVVAGPRGRLSPMLHIQLDAVGGIAGDMFVAALLDAFPHLRERVLADARAVLPAGCEPRLSESRSGPLRGLGFGLAGEPQHHHDHGDHDHGTGSFIDMVARIRAARLGDGTADQAVAVLTLIAEVEAAIHQVPIEAVHFHEIADWDSLLDVVAAGSVAAALPGVRWAVSPLPRGGGLVKTQHGLLPVPAPATAALLTGFVWRDDGIGGERVTPTGAAILRHLVGADGSGVPLPGRLVAVGTGAGTRTLAGIPNVLRALVFDATPAATQEQIAVVSFDIDDMTAEEIAVAADRLRAVDGVLDLTIAQAQGKKGRLMQAFRLLVRPDRAEAVAERCFLETSTIGLRLAEERRIVLPRRQSKIGAVGIKTVERSQGPSVKAESDDLAGDNLEARRRLKRQAET